VTAPDTHPGANAAEASNRGAARYLDYQRTGNIQFLQDAITAFLQAVGATPAGHAGWHALLSNLGTALQDRFERTAQRADLDQAITLFREAADNAPGGHSDQPMYLSKLGTALAGAFRAHRKPVARNAREIKAEHSSTVVHADRDIRGDITIVHDQRGHELGMFNSYIEAGQLAAMPHDEAAKSIARSSVAASAPVLQALLSTDSGLAISLLATITQRQAEELLAAVGSPEADDLADLLAAAAAMAECAARLRSDLGNPCGWFERAGTSDHGTEGFWREFERGGIHWSASAGPQATIGPIAVYHRDEGGSRRRLGFPLAPTLSGPADF